METLIPAVTSDLKNGDIAAAAAKIKKYLEEERNITLNIAITGESGSGKSTFVNAFRGLGDEDEGSAPTGVTETTIKVTGYPHPHYPNVTLWDLPGIGTTNFPADSYLKYVEFERFDFFIIISSDRFRENDVKLTQEIQKMKKMFYFVRSKIDHNLNDEKRKKNFNEATTLTKIRENCVQGLIGIKSPQVFLVSSFALHLFDFPLLHETLERELSAHKRSVLLLAMPTINLEIINKKKEVFQAKIKWHATLSAAAAAVPLPGLSVAVDAGLIASVVKEYVTGFGLDKLSLKRITANRDVSYTDLSNVIKSKLVKEKITIDLIKTLLLTLSTLTGIMVAEEISSFIPIIGTAAAMSLSFTFTYKALNIFLNDIADDAQRVLQMALGLNTSL